MTATMIEPATDCETMQQRILIADDQKDVLDALQLLLKGQGYLLEMVSNPADLLAALARSFGAVTVQPMHPRPEAPAIRVLVRAIKGSRAPLALLPGLVLAGADGRPSEAAEAVLRHGAALPLAKA